MEEQSKAGMKLILFTNTINDKLFITMKSMEEKLGRNQFIDNKN